MQIYRFPGSRSLKPIWTMEELELPYETIKVLPDPIIPGASRPFPSRKVPFLVDDAVQIDESLAICIYLCEKYDHDVLYPADEVLRSLVNSRLSFVLTELEPPIWGLIKQTYFTPAHLRNAGAIQAYTQDASRVLSQIPFDGTTVWFTGDTFTLADIFLTQTLLWAKALGLPVLPRLNRYLSRAQLRTAYKTATANNDAD